MRHEATADEIVNAVAPGTDVDAGLLEALLSRKPKLADVVPLVSAEDAQVARAAVLYLGLYGGSRECPVLALCLQHADAGVAKLAERGLWSIWMQSGSRDGNQRLTHGVASLAAGETNGAIRILSLLVATEPQFAEAHFQLGLALSSADRSDEAARAYREALRLNPYHFAAAAALGHACVEQGNLPAALRYYQQALQIHPRLSDIPEAVGELERILNRRSAH